MNILMLNLAAVQLNKVNFNGKFALWQGGGAQKINIFKCAH